MDEESAYRACSWRAGADDFNLDIQTQLACLMYSNHITACSRLFRSIEFQSTGLYGLPRFHRNLDRVRQSSLPRRNEGLQDHIVLDQTGFSDLRENINEDKFRQLHNSRLTLSNAPVYSCKAFPSLSLGPKAEAPEAAARAMACGKVLG